MTERFLLTRIPTVDEEEVEKLEATLGRKPIEGKDIEYTYAETVIDLMEVSAVRESYDSAKLMENEAVIYMYGEPYFIQSPYKEVLAQWLRVMKGEPSRTLDVADAVDILSQALAEDKKEGSLYYGYQSNIAMAFKDCFVQHPDIKAENIVISKFSSEALHEIANQAAKNFLDQLIKSVE